MRFKTKIHNVSVFAKFCASLSSLSNIAWARFNDEDIQFTIIPEKGSQCWSALKIDTIFEQYTIQSASEKNTINLEVPIQALTRALKSAANASEVLMRLTKKDHVPILCLTVRAHSYVSTHPVASTNPTPRRRHGNETLDHEDVFNGSELEDPAEHGAGYGGLAAPRERQTLATLDIPVKVLPMTAVEGLHEPQYPEPDVHIYMPNLAQLKSISERFAKLASSSSSSSSSSSAAVSPRLELSANMHGSLRIAVRTDALNISSSWTGLENPELDAGHVSGGSQGIRDHPSTRMRELDPQDEAAWAKVRIDAKDWSRVLSVGRVSARVIGCFINDSGLVMYCWIGGGGPDEGDQSCLTYFISSFSV